MHENEKFYCVYFYFHVYRLGGFRPYADILRDKLSLLPYLLTNFGVLRLNDCGKNPGGFRCDSDTVVLTAC